MNRPSPRSSASSSSRRTGRPTQVSVSVATPTRYSYRASTRLHRHRLERRPRRRSHAAASASETPAPRASSTSSAAANASPAPAASTSLPATAKRHGGTHHPRRPSRPSAPSVTHASRRPSASSRTASSGPSSVIRRAAASFASTTGASAGPPSGERRPARPSVACRARERGCGRRFRQMSGNEHDLRLERAVGAPARTACSRRGRRGSRRRRRGPCRCARVASIPISARTPCAARCASSRRPAVVVTDSPRDHGFGSEVRRAARRVQAPSLPRRPRSARRGPYPRRRRRPSGRRRRRSGSRRARRAASTCSAVGRLPPAPERLQHGARLALVPLRGERQRLVKGSAAVGAWQRQRRQQPCLLRRRGTSATARRSSSSPGSRPVAERRRWRRAPLRHPEWRAGSVREHLLREAQRLRVHAHDVRGQLVARYGSTSTFASLPCRSIASANASSSEVVASMPMSAASSRFSSSVTSFRCLRVITS